MARKFIVGGNWKCNPASAKEANSLLKEWKKGLPNVDKSKVDVVICPPALWMSTLGQSIEGLGMEVCSQNVGKTDAGAFTGEWTAGNLLDLGIKWTLIGHSERRTKYGETDADVAEKVGKCQDIGVNVILCIGETLEEREGGKTDEVNKRQLGAVIPKVKDWDKIVIAYEPVWAIGTGKVATPDQAEETQAAIREYLKSAVSAAVADKVRIQYGGSVTPENCAELITKPNIDGFLVGGASLKPSFMEIVSKVGPSKMAEMWPKFEEKMKKDGMNETAMAAFKYTYGVLVSGADVMIPESKLDPVESLTEVVDKLHQKAAVAEEKATQLKEAFHKVQVAHEEGNCQRATAAAEANFQDLPLCKQDLDQAAEDMTTQFHLAQPSCKRGAVMLQALREMSMPWPLLAARISELQHQRRADFL